MWKLLVLLIAVPLIAGQYNTNIGNNALRQALNSALWETLSYNNGEFALAVTTKWLGTPSNFTTDCGTAGQTAGLYAYPPRPADGTLAKILDSGVALVGYGAELIPYYYVNGSSSNFIGLTVDITDAVLYTLGQHYGVTVKQQQVQKTTGINDYLKSDFDDFDFSARFLTSTVERRQLAVWSCGFWPTQAKVAVNTNVTYQQLVTGNYKFAIQSGSFYDTVRLSDFPNSTPVYVASSTAAFENLLSGANGVVATVNDEAALRFTFGNNPNITILSPVAGSFYIGWQTRYEICSEENYGNLDLQYALNSALSTVNYTAIYAKYPQYDLPSYNFAFSCPLVSLTNYPVPGTSTPLSNITSLSSAKVGYGTATDFYYEGTPYTGFAPDVVGQILNTLRVKYSVSNITENQVIITTPATTYLKSLNQVDFSARFLANSNTVRNQLAAWTCNFWKFSYRVMSKNADFNSTAEFNTASTKFSYLTGSVIYDVIQDIFPLAQTQAYSTNEELLNAVRDGTNGVTATVQDYAILEYYINENSGSGLVQLATEIGYDEIGFQVKYDSCDIGTYAGTTTTGTTGENSAFGLCANLVIIVAFVACLIF